MRDDLAYLHYVLESIQVIERRTAAGRAAFEGDDLIQDAVLRRLETLADAATHVSVELRKRHQDVDWGRIAGFRNRLAHGYLDVDLGLVWQVIGHDLPILKSAAESELRQKE